MKIIRYILPKDKVDIIIISYNSCDYNLKCIESIYASNDDLEKNIIVVDNASTDNSVPELKLKYPNIKIIENKDNYGYAKAVNIGVKEGVSDYIIASNSDVEFFPNSINELINCLKKDSTIGSVGPQQVFPNGKWQRSYGDLPSIKLGLKNLFFITHLFDFFKRVFFKINKQRIKEVAYIDGAVIVARRIAFEQVNGYDEDYFFYTEEADFCFKLKQNNWKVVFVPSARVMHHRGGSSENNKYKQNKMLISSKVLFCKKHLPFQQTKFYMILEIFYSSNLLVLWFLIFLISVGSMKQKSKIKFRTFKSFLYIWIDEMMILMGDKDEKI